MFVGGINIIFVLLVGLFINLGKIFFVEWIFGFFGSKFFGVGWDGGWISKLVGWLEIILEVLEICGKLFWVRLLGRGE